MVIAVHGARSIHGRRTWCGAVAVGVYVALLASPADAQPSERPALVSPGETVEHELIRIEYDADPSCPTYEELVAKVRAYTSRWSLARDGDDARRFRLVLRPGDGRFVGTLAIADPSSEAAETTTASRTITGPDCTTVARGMAIAVAIAVDPSALFSDRRADPEPPADAPSPPTPSEAPREKAPPPPRRREPEPRATRFAIDARVELSSAVLAGLLPVASAALEVEPLAGARSMRLPRWLRPSLAIGARQSLDRSVERTTVTTTFLWTAGVIRLCPARFVGVGDRLELTPCIESDLGVLRASATGSSDARSATNPWIDVGASARATWSIGGGWFIGGAASAVLPLSRNRFELSTGTLVSQAPRIGVTFGLAGGLRF